MIAKSTIISINILYPPLPPRLLLGGDDGVLRRLRADFVAFYLDSFAFHHWRRPPASYLSNTESTSQIYN